MPNVSKINSERSWNKWRNSGAVIFNQQRHPEIGPDEVWITNSDNGTPAFLRNYEQDDHNDYGFHSIGLKTKRKGRVAFDNLGRPLGNRWPGSFPVFAKKSEVEANEKKYRNMFKF